MRNSGFFPDKIIFLLFPDVEKYRVIYNPLYSFEVL